MQPGTLHHLTRGSAVPGYVASEVLKPAGLPCGKLAGAEFLVRVPVLSYANHRKNALLGLNSATWVLAKISTRFSVSCVH